jgi:hypothetical protein
MDFQKVEETELEVVLEAEIRLYTEEVEKRPEVEGVQIYWVLGSVEIRSLRISFAELESNKA